VHVSCLPFVPHAPSILFSFISFARMYLMMNTGHKASRYAVYSTPLLLCPSQVQISSPHYEYSGTPSTYVEKIRPSRRPSEMFHNIGSFYSEELSAPLHIPKLEASPLSAARDCLFNIFAATLHSGGRSSYRILRAHHAVVTESHISRHNFRCMQYQIFVSFFASR
jgi:hypothetical protein